MPDALEPHAFVGRLDRNCEVCGHPDRHIIHARKTPRQTPDRFVSGMREAYPDLCWFMSRDGRECCINPRGHDGGIHERPPTEVVFQDVYAVRRIVARWLRIRGDHVTGSMALSEHLVPRAHQPALFTQLAADADHSDLLVRLLQGEEPLPFDEWKARGTHGA